MKLSGHGWQGKPRLTLDAGLPALKIRTWVAQLDDLGWAKRTTVGGPC
jgi:hypothetical protein